MPKTVKRLFDLDIDEVSLVDRAANQHAVITFTKRADPEEVQMPGFYDSDGDLVDEETLDTGDVVYDTDGNEFVYLDDNTAEELVDAGEIDADDLYELDDEEFAEVGKGFLDTARTVGRYAGIGAENRRAARAAAKAAASAGGEGGAAKKTAWQSLKAKKDELPAWALPAAGGAALTATGAGGYAAMRRGKAEKSLGASVYEELSKALTDSDRDEVISKAMDVVAQAREEAAQANARVAELEARERLAEYVSKAAEYDLPVDPEALAALLYELEGSVSKGSAQLFSQILEQASQAGLYDELGSTGDYVDTEVMGMVSGFADQLVGKSDLTREQAVVALFETNPSAYDQYIAEQR